MFLGWTVILLLAAVLKRNAKTMHQQPLAAASKSHLLLQMALLLYQEYDEFFNWLFDEAGPVLRLYECLQIYSSVKQDCGAHWNLGEDSLGRALGIADGLGPI